MNSVIDVMGVVKEIRSTGYTQSINSVRCLRPYTCYAVCYWHTKDAVIKTSPLFDVNESNASSTLEHNSAFSSPAAMDTVAIYGD
jgi:hypothetical protein